MAKIGCLKPFRGSYNNIKDIVLEDGEIAFDITYKRIFFGNGTKTVTDLNPFIYNPLQEREVRVSPNYTSSTPGYGETRFNTISDAVNAHRHVQCLYIVVMHEDVSASNDLLPTAMVFYGSKLVIKSDSDSLAKFAWSKFIQPINPCSIYFYSTEIHLYSNILIYSGAGSQSIYFGGYAGAILYIRVDQNTLLFYSSNITFMGTQLSTLNSFRFTISTNYISNFSHNVYLFGAENDTNRPISFLLHPGNMDRSNCQNLYVTNNVSISNYQNYRIGTTDMYCF